jgi:hypothetical protein
MTGRLPRCSQHESPGESGGPSRRSGAEVCPLPTRIVLSYLTYWVQRSSSHAQLPGGPRLRALARRAPAGRGHRGAGRARGAGGAAAVQDGASQGSRRHRARDGRYHEQEHVNELGHSGAAGWRGPRHEPGRVWTRVRCRRPATQALAPGQPRRRHLHSPLPRSGMRKRYGHSQIGEARCQLRCTSVKVKPRQTADIASGDGRNVKAPCDPGIGLAPVLPGPGPAFHPVPTGQRIGRDDGRIVLPAGMPVSVQRHGRPPGRGPRLGGG